MRTLCLGEALVDLVREGGDAYVPHPGGAMANTCVIAARLGADVALAGGAGDDDWGAWLRDRLLAERVDLACFELAPEAQTAVAFVTVDGAGEPRYTLYGPAARLPAERLPEAVEGAAALCLSSNTLVEDDDREATLAARERALELGRPVLFDANLRLHRWPHPGRAASVARECLPGAFLVKANRAEAEALSGEADPVRAAEGLVAAGARHVVVTLGAHGAVLRGELRREVPGVPARVCNAAGAGDAFLGVLIARLAQAAWYPPALAAALPEAVAEAARATERWGAT